MALVGLGRCADAVPLAEQAIEIMRDYGYPIRLVMMLDTLAQACRGSGRLSEAIDHLAEAVQLCRDFAGTHPAAQVLNTLGEPYGHAGDHLLARASHDEALELAEFASDRTERTRALVGLGEARSATSTAPGRCSRKRSTSTRRWAFRSPRGSGLGSLHLQ